MWQGLVRWCTALALGWCLAGGAAAVDAPATTAKPASAASAATAATAASAPLSVWKQLLADATSELKAINKPVSEFVTLAWRLLLALALGVGGLLFVQEWRRDAMVLEPFDTPKDLQDLGLTGTVFSQLVSDHISAMQRSSRIDDDASDINFVELQKLQVDLQLPGVAWSLRGIIRYLRQAVGRPENRLLGEVIRKGSGYGIRLRMSSGRARNVPVAFTGTDDLDPALRSAAEVALTLMDPFEAASILYSSESYATGFDKTVAALRLHLASAPTQRHQDAYVMWASVHRALGEKDAMQAKLEQARAVHARLWQGQTSGPLRSRYCNFVGGLHREQLEFEQAERHLLLGLRSNPRTNIAAMSNLGLLYLDWMRLDDAELWFRRVVRARPNSSRGYRGLGLVAQRSYQPQAALRWYERAIDVAPQARWPRINHIEALRYTGELGRATAAALEFQSIDKQFAPLFRVLGDILRDRCQFSAALTEYRHSVALGPFDPFSQLRVADALRRLGKLDEAQAAAEGALRLRPRLVNSLHTLAQILRERGDDPRALALVEEAHRQAPHDPVVHMRLADELRDRGRMRDAQTVLTQVPPHCTMQSEILRAWGWLHSALGEYEAAQRYFAAAVERAPYEVWNQAGLVHALCNGGQAALALPQAEAATARWPHVPDAWRALSRARRDLNDLDNALQACDEGLRLDPVAPVHRLDRAELLRRQGQFVAACAELQQVLAVRPWQTDALRNWGAILRQQNDPVAAVEKFEQAAALGSFRACIALSDLHRGAKRHDQAVAAAARAKAMAEQSSDARWALVASLRAKGANETAIGECHAALAEVPGAARFAAALNEMQNRQP